MSQYKSGDKVYVTGLYKDIEHQRTLIGTQFSSKEETLHKPIILHEKNMYDKTWSIKNERDHVIANEKVYETEGEFNEWRNSNEYNAWLSDGNYKGAVWYITKKAGLWGGKKSRKVKKSKRKRTRKSKTKKRRSNRRK